MKKITLVGAILIGVLATSLQMLPLIVGNKKVAIIQTKVIPIKQNNVLPNLPKHNLNNGQLKRMYFLKYLSKL